VAETSDKMKDDYTKIPIRITILSGLAFVSYGIFFGIVFKLDQLSTIQKETGVMLLNLTIVSLRCPLTALLAFASDKKAVQTTQRSDSLSDDDIF
jgi:hypothetical protein